ncbi:hypothetical protein SPRG_17557 [Saprolegnia parasitica CBS 223.65]|uniref:F-box domain-containing protein n=1 Tax=Saprolegnia parasitica (strain CBS 223.65) TaxID=695850 RepID=A0A067BFS6_SAPPC|nr:hypothetical protein SPRG_17557 [Saprolegnia parasitica CBS 223.65]KDO17008.1 hypothetical protein SPRG_17557 [Saprolegnia parasitica CBS 223.65]|eukprot:XP_012212284.1 hypothetical protein SPRG_17557 [Saprolegnia parasitica CBS 223.65]
MSSAKRPAAAPTTISNLEGALLGITMCLQTPEEVLVFLDAVDSPALCKPLAALLRLLRDPRSAFQNGSLDGKDDLLSYVWPCVKLNCVRPKATGLVVDAMAAFPAMRLCRDVYMWQPHSESNLDMFMWLVATWGHKLQAITILSLRDDKHLEPLCNALRQCTGLDAFTVATDIMDYVLNYPTRDGPNYSAELIAAVTTPNHHVRRMRIVSYLAERDWVEILGPWLASPHAQHLRFQHTSARSDDNIRRLVVAARFLSSLDLDIAQAGGLPPIDGDGQARFENLSALRVQVRESDAPFVQDLLQRLDPRRLTHLAISCESDFSYVLDALPRYTALQELEFDQGRFHHVASLPLSGMPALRSAIFSNVDLSDQAVDALVRLFADAPALVKLIWNTSDETAYVRAAIARSLRHWINHGVRDIQLDFCHMAKNSELAAGLCNAASPLGATVSLAPNKIAPLLKALATCAGVTLQRSVDTRPQDSFPLAIEAIVRNLAIERHRDSWRVRSPPYRA